MDQPKIPGTYPFDEYDADYNPAWKQVRDLTLEEARELAGIFHESEDGYLWMNKGFIVLGLEQKTGDDGVTTIQAAFGEMMGGVLSPNIDVGMLAVYLHDGSYSLIERLLPVEHTMPSIH